MRERCPYCKAALVPAWGPLASKVLILGEFPGKSEIRDGRPWTGQAGEVLKAELGRVGLSLASFRSTNLWLHAPSKECERDWHYTQALKELKGKEAVLLCGSEVASLFLDAPISNWTGMRVKSKLLPKSVKVAMAMYNPAIALRGGVGEVRLAIERFAKLTEGLR